VQNLGVRFLMTRIAPHDSASSTIRPSLHAHGVRLSGRTKQRRITRDVTIDASRASEYSRRFLKRLK
jgi:hypothetical protein